MFIPAGWTPLPHSNGILFWFLLFFIVILFKEETKRYFIFVFYFVTRQFYNQNDNHSTCFEVYQRVKRFLSKNKQVIKT